MKTGLEGYQSVIDKGSLLKFPLLSPRFTLIKRSRVISIFDCALLSLTDYTKKHTCINKYLEKKKEVYYTYTQTTSECSILNREHVSVSISKRCGEFFANLLIFSTVKLSICSTLPAARAIAVTEKAV